MNNPTYLNSMDRCGVMKSAELGKWYDYKCSDYPSFNIMCQQDASIQDPVNVLKYHFFLNLFPKINKSSEILMHLY